MPGQTWRNNGHKALSVPVVSEGGLGGELMDRFSFERGRDAGGHRGVVGMDKWVVLGSTII